LTIKTETPLK